MWSLQLHKAACSGRRCAVAVPVVVVDEATQGPLGLQEILPVTVHSHIPELCGAGQRLQKLPS